MPLTTAADPPFKTLTSQVNRLMEQMQKGYYNFYPGEIWAPAVNLYETESTYIVCVDLAGVDKEKIDLEIVDQHLKLKGTRAVPTHPEPSQGEDIQTPRIRVHLMEIDHGAFCREVELPLDVIRDSITANYRNGMLWIEIPKK